MRAVGLLLLLHFGVWQMQCASVDSRPEFIGAKVPNRIFQIGPLRTATTLQFLTVCAAVAAKHIDEPAASVDCFFISGRTPESNEKVQRVLGPNEYQVVKTHGKLKKVQTEILNRTAQVLRDAKTPLVEWPWVFHTTYKVGRDKAAQHGNHRDLEGKFGFPTVMTVSTSQLTDGFQSMRKEYMEMLSLTDAQAELVYEWLAVWDQLRVCCGKQMSKKWRQHLHFRSEITQVDANTRGKFGDEEGPISMCQKLDLVKVENALMNTKLYKRMHKHVALLGAVSDADGQLNGNYCQTCEENVRDFKLGFNVSTSTPDFSSERAGTHIFII